MARDEQATIAALEAARLTFRAAAQSHQGRVIDTAGDSVLALFRTAAGAVNAAIDIQATLMAQQFAARQQLEQMRQLPPGSLQGVPGAGPGRPGGPPDTDRPGTYL